MNARKSIAVVAAMLITAAGMSGIANYSNAAADAARHATTTIAAPVQTLPVINVRPSPAQLLELRNEKGGSTAAYDADNRMPYYSFASDAAGA